MGVTVKFTGDVDRVNKLLDPDHWDRVLRREVPDMIEMDAAPQIADEVRNIIASGGAGGPGLASSTVARKGNDVKLNESGAMADAVGVQRIDRETVFVGVLEGKGAHNGLDLARLAALHEAGTATIPARPFMAKAEEGAGEIIMKSLMELFSSSGFWGNF